jgi:periplasmic divalent cation tolerance protein
MKYLAVVTTVASQAQAQQMARCLVERRLAACAQISGIESFYSWRGAVQNENEYRVLFKTTAPQYPALEQAILELHDYELPAVYAFEIAEIHAPYAAWLQDGCGAIPPQ